MAEAWTGVLGIISGCWTWLGSWNFHGVTFAAYLIGFTILSILIDRIL